MIFMSIKHVLPYIVKSTSSEALQTLLKMAPSNSLRQSDARFRTFLQMFLIVSWL